MKYRDDGSVHCVYKIPTRGLLGFRQAFLTNTRGKGVMNTLFAGYGPFAGPIESRDLGSLIAFEAGHDDHLRPERGAGARPALHRARHRGLRGHGRRPAHPRPRPRGERLRKKHLTNMRSSTSDIAAKLDGSATSPSTTPSSSSPTTSCSRSHPTYRIRKRLLAKQDRDRLAGQKKKAAAV